jgi:hypothetical protein
VAITLVTGGAVSGTAGNGGDVTITFPTLLENDVVFVAGGHSNRAANTPGPETAGYTSLVTHTAASPYFNVSWKRMGASPDADVVCHGTGNTADAAAYVAFCLRGVQSTGAPTDATTTTAGPTTSTNPNAPSISPSTAGAWVLAFAGSAVNDGTPGTISGYSNHVQNTANDTGEDYSAAGATKEWSGVGAEDPGAWSTWASGAWYAATVAVKPDTAITAALTTSVATVSAGTVTPALSKALSGEAATVSAGTLTPTTDKALSGSAATVSTGTLTASFLNNVESGIIGIGVVGQMIIGKGTPVTVNLTGSSATVSAGTVGVSHTQALTGESVTGSAGTLTPVISLGITGTSLTTASGTFAVVRDKPLTTQAATVSAGTLVANLTTAIAGSLVTTSTGTLSPATAPRLSGTALTASAGDVASERTVGLSGSSATTSAGTFIVSLSVPLTGAEMIAEAGFLSVETFEPPVVTLTSKGMLSMLNVRRSMRRGRAGR